MTKRKLSWRCASIQQQRDKAEIYNSREWRELKARWKQEHPLCEMCQEEGRAKGIRYGYVTSVQCVHHKIPIETATTKQDMWRLALDWNNLQSLCNKHHAQLHNDAGYHKHENVKKRKESAFERWKAKQEGRTATDAD